MNTAAGTKAAPTYSLEALDGPFRVAHSIHPSISIKYLKSSCLMSERQRHTARFGALKKMNNMHKFAVLRKNFPIWRNYQCKCIQPHPELRESLAGVSPFRFHGTQDIVDR